MGLMLANINPTHLRALRDRRVEKIDDARHAIARLEAAGLVAGVDVIRARLDEHTVALAELEAELEKRRTS